MKAVIATLGLCVSAVLPARTAAAAGPASVYTSLDRKACRMLEHPPDEEPSQMICPGVAGYALRITFIDAREGLAIVDPSGKAHELDFMGLISTGFSALGPKAEWRMDSVGGARTPTALITRFTAQGEDGSQVSYLTVSKITRTRICLVKAITPGPNQNRRAREVADRAGQSACLEPREGR